jgi:hypothetical protein
MQTNPRENQGKGLDFLGFLWPNLAFSMGYDESKQKFFFPSFVPCAERPVWARAFQYVGKI